MNEPIHQAVVGVLITDFEDRVLLVSHPYRHLPGPHPNPHRLTRFHHLAALPAPPHAALPVPTT
jgi:hypothetical protein